MTNAQHSDPECLALASSISALIDGELEGPEKSAVAQHLIQCATCRQQARSYESVNQLILRRGETPAVNHRPAAARRRLGYLTPLAAAAVLLVGVLVNWPQPTPVNADQLTAEEMLRPMQQIQQLTQQQERDQSLMLRTLELNLRTMQLELEALPPGNPQRAAMQERLDHLRGRVLETQFTFALGDL